MVKIHSPTRYKQHPLKPLKGGYVPSVWVFLDTETIPVTENEITSHYFNIGWSCLWIRSKDKSRGRFEWVFHEKAEDMLDYLEALVLRLGDVILAGHNVFFDLQACGFYRVFADRGWSLKFYYDMGLTYILKCERKGSRVTVVSTTNWFDQSLKKLGDNLKLKKLDVDFEASTPEELKTYCRRDVEIIVKAMRKYIEFIQDHDLGRLALTKASQAFTAYRTRFMGQKILIHQEAHIHELERAAYLGGRTECFQIGQIEGGPFVSLDVNAMYPYVMKHYKYPASLVGYYESPSIDQVSGFLKSYAVIAEVEVSTRLPAYAVKVKGKTLFPTGRFTCFLTSTGLEYALKKGHIKSVVRCSLYTRRNLFAAYVDYFHKLRLEYKKGGNDIFLLLCKYMHNALYGKFGQLKMITEMEDFFTGDDYTREDVFNMVTGHNVVITRFMNKELIQYPEGEGDNASVAIAAHITENARFTLWDIMNDVGRSRVLYCDTDSVKIRASDADRLTWPLSQTALGALKIEDKSNELYIQGPKNYRTEHYRKIKGIPHRAEEIEPGVFRFDTFVRQVGHMRAGQDQGVRMDTVTRRLKTPYTKGKVKPDGRVNPFWFPRDLPPS